MSPTKVTGPVALVTGASGGIGSAVALALATEGARVNVGSVVGPPATPARPTTQQPRPAWWASPARWPESTDRATSRPTWSLPGAIDTALVEALPSARRDALTDLVPLGRLGKVEEVAAVVAFLCSEGAGYVSGAVIAVDGGLGMGH